MEVFVASLGKIFREIAALRLSTIPNRPDLFRRRFFNTFFVKSLHNTNRGSTAFNDHKFGHTDLASLWQKLREIAAHRPSTKITNTFGSTASFLS